VYRHLDRNFTASLLARFALTSRGHASLRTSHVMRPRRMLPRTHHVRGHRGQIASAAWDIVVKAGHPASVFHDGALRNDAGWSQSRGRREWGILFMCRSFFCLGHFLKELHTTRTLTTCTHTHLMNTRTQTLIKRYEYQDLNRRT
jgi:hypothetical protein